MRAKLIVDDDEDEDNDCEQSDMVGIILNLAFIDDKYVNEIKFGAGISSIVKSIKTGKEMATQVIGNKVANSVNSQMANVLKSKGLFKITRE